MTEDKPNLGLSNRKILFHKEGDSVGINGKDSKIMERMSAWIDLLLCLQWMEKMGGAV